MPTVVVGDYAYDTNKQIGKGKCATVYEGQHAEKGIKVAIKKVDWSAIPASKRDNLVSKVKQALDVHKAKNYDHVLKLLDFQEIQDDSYMVYELCDDTLENYLGSTPMTEEAALELFKQEAAIVYHKFATAHKFLLNRDTSPENILVQKLGDIVKLKFADISIGQYGEDRSVKWPSYYAPEIITQQDFIDKRKAEVFTLGLTLYRFLVGKLPYTSRSELDAELCKETPFALPDSITEVTDYTKNLLKRSLQLHPDNRVPLPGFLKKFNFDLPEPGTLRFSSSQGDLSPEILLTKIEEATDEIVNLKERIRRLEAEKIEIELQINLKMQQHERDVHEQAEKLNEELQTARQELSDALEQILKSDEQYDALDARKRNEIEELMQQLVQAHEALEEVARKTTEEIVSHKRNIEELKDSLETKQAEIQDIKKEHEMVEMFRQEELASLKRELDDLTELFVQIEQTRREDDDRASNRYDEMVRLKDQELDELRKQISSGSGNAAKLAPNGIGNVKPYSSFTAGSLRPTSPDSGPTRPSWSSHSRPVSPNPPTKWSSPSVQSSYSARPSSTEPEPSPASPRQTSIPEHAKTWTAPQYASMTVPASSSTSSPSLVSPPSISLSSSTSAVKSPTFTAKPSWSPQPKTTPAPAAATPKTTWTPPVKTTPSTTSTAPGQKPAWMMSSSKPSTSTSSSSTPAASSSSASTPAAAAAAAPVVAYTGSLFSANELRAMLKNPGSAFEGFDKAQIEQYLHEAEFQQLLGMSKADYNKLPKWKQAPLKSKAKLF